MPAQKDLSKFVNSLDKLRLYVEQENFKGYDPYDTLNSPIKFKYFGKFAAVLALQFQKRNPINIRPLLGIKKEHNPKALGLFLYSYCKLQKHQPDKNYTTQINYLFNELKNNYTKGFSGYCWGYNFDWASSGKYINRFSPNIVVTAFVAKGVYQYYQLTNDKEALEVLKSIGNFILKDLPITEFESGICFSYTTLGVDNCYNASLLAATVLAQLYSLTKNEMYKDYALKAIGFVVSKQHEDGHWNYSINEQGKERVQIDFHQGYIIDCIVDVIKYTGTKNEKYITSINKGIEYYRKEQFFENGQAKWRLPKIYPVEIHNQTQGIITFCQTKQYSNFAETIADYTIDNMQDTKGFFYYRKLKTYTHKNFLHALEPGMDVYSSYRINNCRKKELKMSRDFTLDIYKQLLISAINAGYTLTSYEDYIINGSNYKKVFILRHDVDDLPENSYQTALIEKELGATGSYFFRVVKQSLHPDVIEKIKNLGHEIAYHYEDMALNNGDIDKAYRHFKIKLEMFRKFYPVKTICMHGSPLSKWDNRLLWKKYNYKELGIIGEPYFDIDFKKVLYITDTGRMWNNETSSVRDKVESGYDFKFTSTNEIIMAFKENKLPANIMLNIHPQRWTNNYILWIREYVMQNLKNTVKKFLIKK